VEDNSAHLEIAKAFLGQKGYEVICATTGYEAIDKLSGCNPDLILIDILLPDISGFDVLNFIKSTEKFNNIPILAISASAMPHEIQTALDKGFDEFISKPIQFSPFLELIQKKLEQNKKTNVLVVDDNYINAELLKETLSQLNYNVKCIHRGQEVLETLEKNNYDLVLLDIMMPEMSGYDVIRLIKEKPALQDIPVIFISALNSTKNIVKGFELGSYDYITKPFNLEELKSKVKAIIKIKQLQDKLKEKKDTLEKIYKYCTDAILTVDNELKIVSCSSIFCDWVRMNEDEIRNKFFYEIVEYKNDATFNGEIIFDDITIKQPYRILEAKGSEIKIQKTKEKAT
jgi:CheY-like chemotaxis protein